MAGRSNRVDLDSPLEDRPSRPSAPSPSQISTSQAASSSALPVATPTQSARPIRRRTPKACGECRRLKLKCDRVFPCQSCIKRGCEGICPEGSLVSGRGSRYILANTEQLHEKIVQMADRIRELEEALKVTCEEHAQCIGHSPSTSMVPHPLLREDLLLVKNQLELYGLDRSQLASRSGSVSTSDESDGDHAKHRPKHSHPPSNSPLGIFEQDHSLQVPLSNNTLFIGTSLQFMDSQNAHFQNGENFHSNSTTSSNMPLTVPQWMPSSQIMSNYHGGLSLVHDESRNPQPTHPYALHSLPSTDYNIHNYRGRSTLHSSQSRRDTGSAMQHFDAPERLPSIGDQLSFHYMSTGNNGPNT